MTIRQGEAGRIRGLPTVKRARLFETEEAGTRCGLCERRCLIPEGERGFCLTRVNLEGDLYTVVFGDIVACESRPVEVKPFFHFHPGRTLMTFCCPSCNLRCPWCQNHRLSRAVPRPLKSKGAGMDEIINSAEASGDIGLCVSFTEPTLMFDYCLGLFREARDRGMVNTFVSNGYMTGEALHMLARAGLDAMNVDIKGSDEVYRDYCQAPGGSEPAWRTARRALDLGIHLEIVHPVVTGLNDSLAAFERVCESHLEFAGPEVPLHITAYHPSFEYSEPPTEIEFLEKAHGVARKMGLLFPYLGNVPGHPFENTYCPECGELLLQRSGFRLERDLTDDRSCPSCGYALPVAW